MCTEQLVVLSGIVRIHDGQKSRDCLTPSHFALATMFAYYVTKTAYICKLNLSRRLFSPKQQDKCLGQKFNGNSD